MYIDVTIICKVLVNLGLCLTLMAYELGGIFIVPHLLWHSVFAQSEGPPHLVVSYVRHELLKTYPVSLGEINIPTMINTVYVLSNDQCSLNCQWKIVKVVIYSKSSFLFDYKVWYGMVTYFFILMKN